MKKTRPHTPLLTADVPFSCAVAAQYETTLDEDFHASDGCNRLSDLQGQLGNLLLSPSRSTLTVPASTRRVLGPSPSSQDTWLCTKTGGTPDTASETLSRHRRGWLKAKNRVSFPELLICRIIRRISLNRTLRSTQRTGRGNLP